MAKICDVTNNVENKLYFLNPRIQKKIYNRSVRYLYLR